MLKPKSNTVRLETNTRSTTSRFLTVASGGRTRALAIVAIAGAVAVAGVIGTARMSKDDPSEDASVQVTSIVAVSQPATATQVTPSRSPAAEVTAAVQTKDPALSPITAERALLRAKCTLPSWSTGDETFLRAALTCLDAAWKPLLESINVDFTSPALQLSTAGAPSNCQGKLEGASYYCSGTIYLEPSSYQKTASGPAAVAIAALSMVSHEYGHHVQQLSGTLPAAIARIDDAGRQSALGLELLRRTELQAQCLSGMFMGATFDAVTVDVARHDSLTRGDHPKRPRDHGSSEHFGGWFSVGADLNSLAVCNTWNAPADAVS